ncbi:response regulator transcription factor [Amycolatopsis nalaikhensis]|uniref:Helix-turn-helix transcriptional regulator n=1 Tax=Amycolatopsis nalaikhensis TaxID=715472 RepID=A0ABY8XC27_9PSEU|nr:helix-turn-helix transcriptional regulator [Amycolatopsis sp. 2-2]WIV52879.1 helix-turn-helix transcriptional regulator [Amycolatopsis sp. 2-2]
MPRSSTLTTIERGILNDVASGLNTIQIGFKQHRSPETIRTHMKNILVKLKARNRAHAVANAYNTGILTCPLPHLPRTQPVPATSLPPRRGPAPTRPRRTDVSAAQAGSPLSRR